MTQAAGHPAPPGPDDEGRVILPTTAPIARRGWGPVLMGGLVVGAFVVGLVRPWDWLGSDQVPEAGPPARVGVTDVAGPADASVTGAGNAPSDAPVAAPTCAYPLSWRTAAVQEWAGREATVWSAADAVPAAGPTDQSIPFGPVVSSVVSAIGWCAPVEGRERPPLSAVGTLFLLRGDGTAVEVRHSRLEPAAPDALGELWAPVGADALADGSWAAGRYVLRLATPSGGYIRYLGLEVVLVPDSTASPSPGGSGLPPDGAPSPGGSGLPAAASAAGS